MNPIKFKQITIEEKMTSINLFILFIKDKNYFKLN